MSKTKQIKGFVRWYSESSDDGHLEDYNGVNYYFNSWSFPKTMYKVTGIDKKTGKKKTIKTRKFPGLFLQRQEMKDPTVNNLDYGTAVTFIRYEDYDRNWAIDVVVDRSKKAKREFLEYRLERLLENQTPDPKWQKYHDGKIAETIAEIIGE